MSKLNLSQVLEAMETLDKNGLPTGFDPARYYFAVHPENGRFYPVKALWNTLTGRPNDFNAVQAKAWLEKLTIYVHDIRKDDQGRSFDQKVSVSLRDNRQNRLRRLQSAPVKPTSEFAAVRRFTRNSDVVAERLFISAGKCGHCRQDAPFLRASDGSPFLEVHHVKPLADGGEDTVKNTLALCPNCHRKAHFG